MAPRLLKLDSVGFSQKQAEAIVSYRTKNGDFESLEELSRAGVSQPVIDRLRSKLSEHQYEAFYFSSRPFFQQLRALAMAPRATPWSPSSMTAEP